MKQYQYKINGNSYDVTIDSINGQLAKVEVNGIPFEVEMLSSQLNEDNLPEMAVANDTVATATPTAAPATQAEATPTATTGAGAGTPVKAPLPGVITKVLVNVGQAVKKGENVVVLEAMKMENNIAAENDGTVTGIAVKTGDSVMEGDVLVTIQ